MTITLETERLLLRPMDGGDVEHHVAMMSEPRSAEFLTPEGKVRDYGVEWRMAAALIGHWQIRGFGFFSVIEKETGDWIGRVGPWQPGDWPGLEVGWAITASRWGKGYAPEAAIAAMRWVFDQYKDLDRIISVIDPENNNSAAVAKKIGESKSDETFDYFGYQLDVWEAQRDGWLAQFG